MTTSRASTVANGRETAAAVRTLENYIGGRWTKSDSTQFGDVFNPATGEILAQVPLGARTDVDRAVQAAHHRGQIAGTRDAAEFIRV